MPLHLWSWEDDHAPGETAEQARRWLAEASGVPLEECGKVGDWVQIPDGEAATDEAGAVLGTAAEIAAQMLGPTPPLAPHPVAELDDASDHEGSTTTRLP